MYGIGMANRVQPFITFVASLAGEEGIVVVGVCVSVCLCVCLSDQPRRSAASVFAAKVMRCTQRSLVKICGSAYLIQYCLSQYLTTIYILQYCCGYLNTRA